MKLCSRFDYPALGIPLAGPLPSRRISFSAIVNSVKPQFMQVRSLGNTQTAGLLTFSNPRTCTAISPAKFLWSSDPQDLHIMKDASATNCIGTARCCVRFLVRAAIKSLSSGDLFFSSRKDDRPTRQKWSILNISKHRAVPPFKAWQRFNQPRSRPKTRGD